MSLKALVCVPGTWALDGELARAGKDWWQSTSPLWSYLRSQGFYDPFHHRPFMWSTSLDIRTKRNWHAGGLALEAWLIPPLCEERRLPPEETRLLCHSHGGQLVWFTRTLLVRTLVTVGTPVRADLRTRIEAGRDRVGYWTHFYADRDKTQLAGSLLDGKLGLFRRQESADVNVLLPQVGHSRLLHDPTFEESYWPLLAAYLNQ